MAVRLAKLRCYGSADPIHGFCVVAGGVALRKSGPLAFAVLASVMSGALGGCGDRRAEAAPPAVTYTSDRISFAPTILPLVKAATGSTQAVASLLNVPRRMDYGDFKWNDDQIPPGRVWVLVDLKAQTMSVFRGMHEIGTAVTLYGVDSKPTPIGRFKVLERREDHWSSLYDAPMPYTLRLTGDGVAIHGSDVREGAGTHGCLGVPLDFGQKLFGSVRVGDEVLIVRDATGPQSPVFSRG